MNKMDINQDGMLQEEEFCLFLGAAIMRERLADSKKKKGEGDDDAESQQRLTALMEVVDCELPSLV